MSRPRNTASVSDLTSYSATSPAYSMATSSGAAFSSCPCRLPSFSQSVRYGLSTSSSSGLMDGTLTAS